MSGVAIITGASSGIGKEFALYFDQKEELDEIWLIARNPENLNKTKAELKRIPTRIMALDLAKELNLEEFLKSLAGHKIKYLVHSAGFGEVGPFSESLNPGAMVQTHIHNPLLLTHRLLPYFNSGSAILFLASSAGFFPMQNFLLYSSTKLFLMHFAFGLAGELQSRGIHVMAICPGPVRTPFLEKTYLHTTFKAPSDFFHARAHAVVTRAMRDLEHKRLLSIYGIWNKLWYVLTIFLPRRILLTPLKKFFSK